MNTERHELAVSTHLVGPPRPQQLAKAILLDCSRTDWSQNDLEDRLEGIYQRQGPATAAEVWRILKSLASGQALRDFGLHAPG